MNEEGIVILTPELAERRIEARERFPAADFLPGDPVPHGLTVYRWNGEPCLVLREYVPQQEDHHLRFWWVVQSTFADGKTFECLDWPPTLSRKPKEKKP